MPLGLTIRATGVIDWTIWEKVALAFNRLPADLKGHKERYFWGTMVRISPMLKDNWLI